MRTCLPLFAALTVCGCTGSTAVDAGPLDDAGFAVLDAGDTQPPADAGTPADAGVVTGALFEHPLPWTKQVSTLPASSRSTAIITALQSLGGWGFGQLQVDFTISVLTANAATPRQTVTAPAGGYCYSGPDCDPVPAQVPLPVNGNTEGSATYTCDTSKNDCHVLVIERDERRLYELYNATKTATGFTALGVFTWDLRHAYGEVLRGDQCTSADAAGLPMTALLATADEVASGDIGHALRFILPNPRMKKGVYVRPATHAGGPSSTNPDAPPYGVRFRLKASVDESRYNAAERTVLHAMKQYGLILSDGGNVALTFADDRNAAHTWVSLGVKSDSFVAITVGDFEVVDLGAEVPLTFDCVRAP
jgi:hypothetical protein